MWGSVFIICCEQLTTKVLYSEFKPFQRFPLPPLTSSSNPSLFLRILLLAFRPILPHLILYQKQLNAHVPIPSLFLLQHPLQTPPILHLPLLANFSIISPHPFIHPLHSFGAAHFRKGHERGCSDCCLCLEGNGDSFSEFGELGLCDGAFGGEGGDFDV